VQAFTAAAGWFSLKIIPQFCFYGNRAFRQPVEWAGHVIDQLPEFIFTTFTMLDQAESSTPLKIVHSSGHQGRTIFEVAKTHIA